MLTDADEVKHHIVGKVPMFPLPAECPAQLDGDEIALGNQAKGWARNDFLPVSIPNDKEIVAGLDRPAKAIVCADAV